MTAEDIVKFHESLITEFYAYANNIQIADELTYKNCKILAQDLYHNNVAFQSTVRRILSNIRLTV